MAVKAEIRPHASLPTDGNQLFIYYGSRQAQPERVRRFIGWRSSGWATTRISC